MTFIWPMALWLLLLIPILAGLYVLVLKRRKRSVARYPNLAIVRAAMETSRTWRRHVPPVLLLIAVTVLIVAVARPAAVVTIPSSRATVILAMDVSGSMQANDVQPSRITAAQDAAKKFISEQPPNVQIGIVAFASIALLVQSPTVEHEPLYEAIDNFELRRGTAVGSGILTSLRTIFPDVNFYYGIAGGTGDPLNAGLANGGVIDSPTPEFAQADPNRPKHVAVAPGSYENAIIILLTDGATTAGPDPVAAGQVAADFGVKVFTVGFGSPSGAVVKFAGRTMRAELDQTTLQEIARRTDAQYFEAQSADDLTRVYNSLATKLVGEKKLTEIAFVFAGIGALFAVAAGMLSLWWFGRLA